MDKLKINQKLTGWRNEKKLIIYPGNLILTPVARKMRSDVFENRDSLPMAEIE